MDNDPAFTSDDAQKYFNDAKIVTQFSAAYHQHQNGVAEMLWARLSPTATIHIQTAPWLGDAYWTDAVEYANEQFRRRPSRANANHEIPYELSTTWQNESN